MGQARHRHGPISSPSSRVLTKSRTIRNICYRRWRVHKGNIMLYPTPGTETVKYKACHERRYALWPNQPWQWNLEIWLQQTSTIILYRDGVNFYILGLCTFLPSPIRKISATYSILPPTDISDWNGNKSLSDTHRSSPPSNEGLPGSRRRTASTRISS